MDTEISSTATDTRWVFRVYAILAGVTGLLVCSWGPLWLGGDLPGLPFYKASLIRAAGGVLMAAACFAFGLDRVEDPQIRRHAMLWYGIGHIALFLVLLSQQTTIWNSPRADWIVTGMLATGCVFFFLRTGTDLGPPANAGLTLLSLSSSRLQPAGALRQRYQRQIQEAALQEERHRLARDLHDSVKQQIFAIQTSAAAAQARFDSDPDGARQALEQVRGSAREAMTEMEAMLDQLRATPLETAGLAASIRQQCEALGFRTGARVEFDAGPLPDNLALEPGACEALFRVAQEALSNVARHARASRVQVRLGVAGDELKLSIQDDGAGFDPARAPRGMGLANIHARGAEFGAAVELSSSAGEGTRLSIAMPLAKGPGVTELNRRLISYAALAAVHLGIALWRQSAFLAVLGGMWLVYCARIAAARSAALRHREVVR